MSARWLMLAFCAGCTNLVPDPRDTIGPLPHTVAAPVDNPTLPATIELGRLLFWDPLLSGDRDVACATCHHPDFAYGDGIAVSVGVGGHGIGPSRATDLRGSRVARNAQSILGTGWNGLTNDHTVPPEMAPMFWDHRVVSLEAQALGPIKSALEMRGSNYPEYAIVDEIITRLRANPQYQALFRAAFGDVGITATTLSKAIAAFERTLVPRNSSFDRYLEGDDDAMSADQIRGLRGFIAQGCSRCHSGPLLSDFRLHKINVPTAADVPADLGDGFGRFRTPSLRMISRTAPYMHNGALKTLDDVFDQYHNIDVTDPLLGGDVEVTLGGTNDFKLFFEALSDGTYDRTVPAQVPSGLPPGGV